MSQTSVLSCTDVRHGRAGVWQPVATLVCGWVGGAWGSMRARAWYDSVRISLSLGEAAGRAIAAPNLRALLF